MNDVQTDADAGSGPPRSRTRRIAGVITTILAAVLVFAALVVPDQIGQLSPGAFVRIPVEGLVAVALLLLLPPRPRRVVAAVLGVLLGVLTILKLLDMGFFAFLARPFDPVLDWVLIDYAGAFLTDALGRAAAIGAAVLALVIAVGALLVMTRSVLRLSRLLSTRRARTARGVALLTVAWLGFGALGTQLAAGLPVAADSTAALAYAKGVQVSAGLADEQAFATAAAVDAYRDTPDAQLLTALRGKDVVLSFVESYGRSAIEDPALAPQVDALLDDGTRRLDALGYGSRSGFLTSPTYGGGSWLAHSTLLSGLWIDSQQRYRTLVSSDRFTLPRAFDRAGWRTVSVMPELTYAWPEGTFYGYDHVYDAAGLGYRGPGFSYANMPDQYTLSTFQRTERAVPGRGPLMAEMPLVSSHSPWAPIPQLLDWNAVGDGTVYAPMATQGDPPDVVWRDPARVRAEYARSIRYTLSSLISYVQTYGDDNLVLVFLGDHQAAPVVTGDGASHDVPITIVAKDPTVLDRIASWNWQPGLRPGPQAPVWRMDAFRDRFLAAFGSTPVAAHEVGR